MGRQVFDLTEGPDDRKNRLQAGRSQLQQAGASAEIIHGQTGKEPRRSTGGKNMTRTDGEISGAFRCPVPEKDRAGIPDRAQVFARSPGQNFKMFRRKSIDQVDGIGHDRTDCELRALRKNLSDAIASRVIYRTGLEYRLYFQGKTHGGRREERPFHAGSMFGLRKHIFGNTARIGVGIRKDRDFAWPSHHVESNGAVDPPFGRRHIGAAWPDDFIHRPDCSGPVGKSRNGLNATDPIGLRNTG